MGSLPIPIPIPFSSPRWRPPPVVVELISITCVARFEPLAIPRATAVVGELELAARFARVARGVACAGKVVVGAAYFAFT